MHAKGWHVSVLALFIFLLPGSLCAQGRSHGYVSLGKGATDLNGGLDWLIKGGPIGIGGEVGIGWVFFDAITVSYHLLDRQPRNYDVFATAGYAGMGSSEFDSSGVTVGSGTTYWPSSHLGLRFDAFKFFPVTTDNHTDNRSPSRYWGVRVGAAFRFR